MSSSVVLVQIIDGIPVAIFRTVRAAIAAQLNGCRVEQMNRVFAVGSIREQIRLRAGDMCERCGKMLTSATGEMHETVPRSKGGEISLANSEWLCHDCHQGRPDSAHGNRRTRFGELSSER